VSDDHPADDPAATRAAAASADGGGEKRDRWGGRADLLVAVIGVIALVLLAVLVLL
jgi:hypothetical protein